MKRFFVVANRVHIQQALSRVRVATVAGVDDTDANPTAVEVLRNQMRRETPQQWGGGAHAILPIAPPRNGAHVTGISETGSSTRVRQAPVGIVDLRCSIFIRLPRSTVERKRHSK